MTMAGLNEDSADVAEASSSPRYAFANGRARTRDGQWRRLVDLNFKGEGMTYTDAGRLLFPQYRPNKANAVILRLRREAFLPYKPDEDVLALTGDETIEGLYEVWLDRLTSPSTYAQFRNYTDIRSLLGYQRKPHPDRVLDAAYAHVMALGSLRYSELFDLLQTDKADRAVIKSEMHARITGARPVSTPHRHQRCSLEVVREILPAALKAAPRTALDPREADSLPSLSETALFRLCKLSTIREPAAIFFLSYCCRAGDVQRQVDYVRQLEVIDALFNDNSLHWNRADDVSVAVRRYINGDVFKEHSDRSRLNVIRCFFRMIRLINVYTEIFNARHRDLSSFRIAAPDDLPLLVKEVRERYQCVAQKTRYRRKKRSDPVSDNIDAILDVAEVRALELRRVARACEAAAEKLKTSGREYLDFTVEFPATVMVGTATGDIRRIKIRAWRETSLLGILAEELPVGVYRDRVRNPLRHRAAVARSNVFFEFCDIKIHEFENMPFWFQLLASCTNTYPARLPCDILEYRRKLIIDWELPRYFSPSRNLFCFGLVGGKLIRNAAASGRWILPIIEFNHAMQFAHVFMRSAAKSGARANEVLQIAIGPDRWISVVDEHGKEATAWLAVPKRNRYAPFVKGDPRFEQPFVLDDVTIRYIHDLIDYSSKHFHDGRPLPIVMPANHIRAKCTPRAYIFATPSAGITFRDMAVFVRFLLAGVSNLRLHDLRHAAANRMRANGVPIERVAKALKHNTDMARYYASETAKQRDDVEISLEYRDEFTRVLARSNAQ
jgi:integrase